MRKTTRDGLKEWHREHVLVLLTELLSYRWNPDRLPERQCPQLIERLSDATCIPTERIATAASILTVCRTPSGASFHRTENGEPVELAINFNGLDHYEAGALFEEYAAFAGDPVIGDRWAQNVDEAILATLGHELAHFVVALNASSSDTQPHGAAFQHAYRLIREWGVNPMLDEFAQSEAQRTADRHEYRLLRKIQALRKMAEDPSSNSHEAERALTQLQALLAKYGLEDCDASIDATPHLIERGVPVIAHGRYKPLLQVCFSIAAFCGVEAVIHTNPLPTYGDWHKALGKRRSIERVTYFGAAVDVEMAVYLSEIVHHAVLDESERYRRSQGYQCERDRGHHASTLLFSFRREFVERLNRRLRQARETVENDWLTSRTDGRAVMTAKDQRLKDALRQRYPKLKVASGSHSAANHVGSAARAGRGAANRVNLNRPVGSRRGLALTQLQ